MIYLHDIDPFAIQFTKDFGIRWYGLSYLAGFIVTYLVAFLAQKKGIISLSKEQISDFIFVVAIGTIIGGRLGYCILYDPELFWQFSSHLPFWGVLAIHEGGMASHGGILGIIVACLYFARKNHLSLFKLMDICAIGGSIGIFFGRIANFINGELVGRAATNFPFVVKFPQDILSWDRYQLLSLQPVVEKLGYPTELWQKLVSSPVYAKESGLSVNSVLHTIIESVQANNQAIADILSPLLIARYPSQLIAGFLEGLLLAIILSLLILFVRKDGVASIGFLLIYPLMRFLGESYRLPDAHIGYQIFDLTRGQILSVFMLLAAIVFTFIILKRRKKGSAT